MGKGTNFRRLISAESCFRTSAFFSSILYPQKCPTSTTWKEARAAALSPGEGSCREEQALPQQRGHAGPPGPANCPPRALSIYRLSGAAYEKTRGPWSGGRGMWGPSWRRPRAAPGGGSRGSSRQAPLSSSHPLPLRRPGPTRPQRAGLLEAELLRQVSQ